jgi:hypothetical protein
VCQIEWGKLALMVCVRPKQIWGSWNPNSTNKHFKCCDYLLDHRNVCALSHVARATFAQADLGMVQVCSSLLTLLIHPIRNRYILMRGLKQPSLPSHGYEFRYYCISLDTYLSAYLNSIPAVNVSVGYNTDSACIAHNHHNSILYLYMNP